jgi:hypothetical protein
MPTSIKSSGLYRPYITILGMRTASSRNSSLIKSGVVVCHNVSQIVAVNLELASS